MAVSGCANDASFNLYVVASAMHRLTDRLQVVADDLDEARGRRVTRAVEGTLA